MAASAPHTYEYVKDGEVLVCPWHCWEFDITTGRSVFNPNRVRVRSYPVTVESEDDSVETYEVTVEKGLVVVHL
jgi:3-phenylpropionate/trans-cinnamate dioxygenase ferredoxin subunit